MFNISNRTPIQPDTYSADKRDEFPAALGRIGCGQILLIRDRVIEASATARAILERESRQLPGRETPYGALRQLLNRAGAQLPIGSTSWLATSTKEGISRLVNQICNARSDGTSAVILLDLDAHPEPTPGTLQRLFGLTAAETQLAVELARGRNLLDVARARRLSRTTVRSHLAALFVKTQTRRQAELVALLGRVAVLP
ncbi:helix-turn-helix transcriptional regulator [Bradyrhizobium erythrophlei]|uniref:helix-turn-helix transcriptional regulator n=1 Tax=Bradyrhizobium erythrophlei TaxID=1437360 RepID=UPI0035E72085